MKIRKISAVNVVQAFVALGAPAKSSLNDPFIFDVMKVLANLRAPLPPDLATLTPYLIPATSAPNLLAYMSSLGQMVSNNLSVNRIFSPYAALLNMVSTSGTPPSTMGPNFNSDLDIILRATGNVSYSQSQQAPMFKKLLAEFTNKVKTAAAGAGKTQLVSALSTSQLLLNVNPIFAALGSKVKPVSTVAAISNELVNTILQYPDPVRFANQNFEMIKEKILRSTGAFGAGTMKQKEEIDRQRAEETAFRRDPSSLGVPPTGTSVEEEIPYKAGDGEWLNPNAIIGLSMFFAVYYQKLKTFPL
jgi:hypothetical protein